MTLHLDDCARVLPRLANGSVDLVLSDPPWKPKHWNVMVQQSIITECLRISRGAVLMFGGGTPEGNTFWPHFVPSPQRIDNKSFQFWRPCWGWHVPADWRTVPMWPGDWPVDDAFHYGPHSSRTPVLLAWQIIKATGARSVLDPFMGTGWVGMACEMLGIPFIGIEINPQTFAVARERIVWAERVK